MSVNLLIVFVIILLYIFYKHQDITEEYNEDIAILGKLKRILLPLDPRINQLKFLPSKSTYTFNKNTIHFCLRDNKGQYYPLNMLIMVAVHELAHSFYPGDSTKHPSDWMTDYTILLKKAEDLKIYDPSIPVVSNYCGVKAVKTHS